MHAEPVAPESARDDGPAGGGPRLEGRRIVFVLNWAHLGGAERQAFLLARHLVSVEGASVTVCALTHQDGRGAELFREHGIPWQPVPVTWAGSQWEKIAGLQRLARRLRAMRPDVLLPYCTVPNVACGVVWKWTGASLCIWNQQDVNSPLAVSARAIERAVRGTPRFITNGAHVADYLAAFGAPRARVRVVHSALAPPAPRESGAAWRTRLDIEEDDIVVCMVAHLHRYKDHETLLRAWRIALDSARLDGRSLVLVLAGRAAGTEHALKALAFDLELGRAVRFPGEVADVAGLIDAADAGALSSRAEGCPNAVLEYMAAGLPVIGTDIPGIRECVGAGGVELLAPPGDAQGLAEAIVRVASDPVLRREHGERNRQRARTTFSPERTLFVRTAIVAQELAAAGARRS